MSFIAGLLLGVLLGVWLFVAIACTFGGDE